MPRGANLRPFAGALGFCFWASVSRHFDIICTHTHTHTKGIIYKTVVEDTGITNRLRPPIPLNPDAKFYESVNMYIHVPHHHLYLCTILLKDLIRQDDCCILILSLGPKSL